MVRGYSLKINGRKKVDNSVYAAHIHFGDTYMWTYVCIRTRTHAHRLTHRNISARPNIQRHKYKHRNMLYTYASFHTYTLTFTMHVFIEHINQKVI